MATEEAKEGPQWRPRMVMKPAAVTAEGRWLWWRWPRGLQQRWPRQQAGSGRPRRGLAPAPRLLPVHWVGSLSAESEGHWG